MTINSKTQNKVSWSQAGSLFNNTTINHLKEEMMFEFAIQDEIEKMHFSPQNVMDFLPIELLCLAGQAKNVQTAQTTRLKPTGEKECSWRRDRRYDSCAGRVNDDVWKHLTMAGGIPDLPLSPERGSTYNTWNKSVKSIGLRANCNSEECIREKMELCNLSDTEAIGEVQSSKLLRGMTVPRGNQINAQPNSIEDQNTLQDQKVKMVLFKTEICKSWK